MEKNHDEEIEAPKDELNWRIASVILKDIVKNIPLKSQDISIDNENNIEKFDEFSTYEPKCQYCGKLYVGKSSKSNNQRHIMHVKKCKKYHSYIIDGSTCKICEKSYPGQILKHLENVHSEEITISDMITSARKSTRKIKPRNMDHYMQYFDDDSQDR